MVGRPYTGQSTLEFILLLSMLTVAGVFLMKKFVPSEGNAGAINAMQADVTTKIAAEE